MKKLIFRKFILDTATFFTVSLLIMGVIVWTLQAVNYFDFVTEDGHGLKIYFFYTILNFPKIIHRILPFIFFISLFYTILSYEFKNELNIFWFNGISKIDFLNKIVIFSLILMMLQIWIGSNISPSSQYKARNFLKNSNVDFFTSLIKDGKFINVVKDLTIFIDRKNEDGSYSDIFLDDSTKNISKMIYAKRGVIIDNEKQKIFKLSDGNVINNDNDKINIFKFDQIFFNLKDFSTNTIVVPKIQEISSKTLISCFINLKAEKFDAFNCDDSIKNQVKEELLKRLYKPIYIPIISLLCCFLIITSKTNIKFNKRRNYIFFIIFFVLVISEASLRYSVSSNFSLILYFMFPWLVFFSSYIIFYRLAKNV